MAQPPSSELTAEQVQLLAERYGPASRASLPGRLLVIGVSVAFLGWVLWMALSQTATALQWRIDSYGDHSATHLSVRFTVTKPADKAVQCTLQAFDATGAVVGEATVPVPAGSPTAHVTYDLHTLRQASGASVQSCVITP